MPISLYTEQLGLGVGDPLVAVEGTNTSVPRGVEALFEYNGIVLNDRSTIDKYRITHIDGLDDADLRDSREDNPAQHGEAALDAFYSGRSIAFTGQIEAYTLSKLRDMQLALRTAFADLTEKPLYFLTNNTDTDHYINCRKYSKIQMGEAQAHASAFFRDFVITVRASDPRFYLVNQSISTLYPNLVPNPSFETNTTGWAATTTNFTSTTFAKQSGWASHGTSSLRLTGTKDNNTTLREIFASTNTGTGGMPVKPSQTYKVKLALNILNPGTQTYAFISWYNAAGTFIQTDLSTDFGVVSGTQTLTMSATSPATAAFAAIGPRLKSNVALDVIDFYTDEVWFVEDHGQTGFGTVQLVNNGNFDSPPTIRIYGPMTNIRFTHSIGDFIIDDALVGTDYYVVDTSIPSMINSSGTNVFASLNPVSDWPIVEAGSSFYTTEVDQSLGTNTTSRIEFIYSSAYI